MDVSVALALFLNDELPIPEVESALGAGAAVWIPVLWHYEIGNALLMAERRGRITSQEYAAYLADISEISFQMDDEGIPHLKGRTLDLARIHRLTIYDATYLELALRKGIGLATLDKELRKAAKAEGVDCINA